MSSARRVLFSDRIARDSSVPRQATARLRKQGRGGRFVVIRREHDRSCRMIPF